MYTFSNKLKTFSIVLMILGLVGIAYGFFTTPQTVEQVEQILAESHHGHEAHDAHAAPAHHGEDAAHADEAHDDAHTKHLEHVLHQLQNKPWAAVYVGCIFVMLVSVGIFTFNQIQYAASVGWSPVLFRVMEALSSYMLPGAILFFILLVASSTHMNHLFIWMNEGIADPNHENYDAIIAGKTGFLNVPFFLIRAIVFLGGWNIFRIISRKNSLALDETGDLTFYKKNFKLAATYLVFFIVTESIMSWDWIMSIDTHWYSTLFGWYVFASFFSNSSLKRLISNSRSMRVCTHMTCFLRATKKMFPNTRCSARFEYMTKFALPLYKTICHIDGKLPLYSCQFFLPTCLSSLIFFCNTT